MLWVAAKNTAPEPMATMLTKCLDTIFNNISAVSPKKAGDLLGLVYREWLLVRLEGVRQAAVLNIVLGQQPMTLARILGLCGFTGWGIFGEAVRNVFTVPVCISNRSAPIIPIVLSSSSRDADASIFMDELENIKVTAHDPVKVIKSWGVPENSTREEEAWDLCLKVFYPSEETGKPGVSVYVFINNKAKEEKAGGDVADVTTPQTIYNFPSDKGQYNHIKDVVREYYKKKQEEEDQKFPFLYVYATTYNISTYAVEQALYVGRTETSSMLGPLAELCRVGRCQFQHAET
jgi:hypothetical protein